MTHSPEGNFGSVPPPATEREDDFDKKWDTGGLSLEGEEPVTSSTERVPEEQTLEELGDSYRVAEVSSEISGESVESTEAVDPVALNNRLVRLQGSARAEAVANLTSAEISAGIESVSKSRDLQGVIDRLKVFGNRPEIVSSSEVTEKLKQVMKLGAHPFTVDRLLKVPGISSEVLADSEVRSSVIAGLARAVGNWSNADWPHVNDAVSRVVEGAVMSDGELREVAEQLKDGSTEMYQKFVNLVGVNRVYPELRR